MPEIPNLEAEVKRLNELIRTRRWPSGLKISDAELEILIKNRNAAAIRLGDLRVRLER